MPGLRLDAQVGADLESHAREVGRSKSVIVRDLIADHLEMHSIDEQIRRAVARPIG